MGQYQQQNQNRSKLQQRIQADLEAKRAKEAGGDGGDDKDRERQVIDGVDDSSFIEGSVESTSKLGVWIALFVMAVVVALFVIITGNQQ